MKRPHGMRYGLPDLLERTSREEDACHDRFRSHFGRIWAARSDQPFDEEELAKLSTLMEEDDENTSTDTDTPIGLAIFGQFIDHDITLDATTRLGHAAGNPERIENFRTPRLDLDSIYLDGPEASPFLYDGHHLLVGTDRNPLDVQRVHRNGIPSTAIIGDPRNDENIFIVQLQSLFIRFHNFVVDRIEAGKIKKRDLPDAADTFHQAQALCRRTYQWLVVNEFLPAVVEQSVLADYISGFESGKLPGPIDWETAPAMPVEFAGAAYRFGHSFIRQDYRLNDVVAGDLFAFDTFSPVEEYMNIDWKYLFNLDGSSYLKAKAIDTRLASALFNLPFAEPPQNNLAARNLIRGQLTFHLPSGEQTARNMDLEAQEKHVAIAALGMDETPLWFYTLSEAERNGGKLGPVGGSIVAGTLLQMLLRDDGSYIHTCKGFAPCEVFGFDPEQSVFAGIAKALQE